MLAILKRFAGPSYHPRVTDPSGTTPVSTAENGESRLGTFAARSRRPVNHHPVLLWSSLLTISAAMLIYAITMGFVWDEGFHLVAAQLIQKGRIPYIDFCFPQTPLNAYWNALWLSWTGLGWKITHVTATLACAGAAVLMADFLFRRQEGRWRFSVALIAGLSVVANQTIWKFGTCAQAYGIGTFLAVCAFRAALPAIVRSTPVYAALAGMFAGAAAGTTLLTAPIAPVIFGWLLIYNHSGRRTAKALAFVCGAAIPFVPILWLFLKAPQQTWFNVVQYQAIFRRVDWPGATGHDFDVITAWLNDAAMFATGLLAIAGVAGARRWSGTNLTRRAEVYLCGAIAAVLVLYICTAHPTFQRYFIFAVPFLGALASIGLLRVCERLGYGNQSTIAGLLASILLLLSLTKDVYDDRDAVTWNNYIRLANRVKELTPASAPIVADEQIYFLLDRTPPTGMEFSYSRKLQLSKREEALYHIISDRELDQQIKAGRYALFESCKDEPIDRIQQMQVFARRQDFDDDCTIFWDVKKRTQ